MKATTSSRAVTEGFTKILAVTFPQHDDNRAAIYQGYKDGKPCWELVQITKNWKGGKSRQIQSTTVKAKGAQWIKDFNQFVTDGVAVHA